MNQSSSSNRSSNHESSSSSSIFWRASYKPLLSHHRRKTSMCEDNSLPRHWACPHRHTYDDNQQVNQSTTYCALQLRLEGSEHSCGRLGGGGGMRRGGGVAYWWFEVVHGLSVFVIRAIISEILLKEIPR